MVKIKFDLIMKIKFIPLLLLLFSVAAVAQTKATITVKNNHRGVKVAALQQGKLFFVSAKRFAEGADAGYYFNNKSGKAEIKFHDFTVTFTGWNQFVVLRKRKDNSWRVVQIPVSAKLIAGDIYFPLQYSLKYLSAAARRKITFDGNSKAVVIGKYKLSRDEIERSAPTPPIVEKSSPYDIYGISVEEKTNGTLIRLHSSKFVRNVRSNILEGKLIIFFPAGITIDPEIEKDLHSSGFVRKVMVKKVGQNSQLEFLLKQGYTSSDAFNDVDSPDLLITIQNTNLSDYREKIKKDKKKWTLDTIVIDPGHGGKDSGALGLYGVKEKDVNLGIGLKLGKLIRKNLKGVKVVFTRKTDKFIELDKRGQIANENHGDLFISLHCNSLIKKPSKARGFEVYLLRPGRSKEAIRIAEYENSVINMENHPERYKKLTDENFILVTMKNSANMRYSEKFSDILNSVWDKKLKIPSRGVKQAGFIVLIGASMPSVLIETGFISNPQDAKYLKSQRGQQEVAQTIFTAIKKYKNYYDKMFENINE
jgi:N-acetylmuramoyl-L-alanine amidase